MPSKSQYLRPRLCVLEKGDNGYGFHLHGEKGKTGQFIRLVEPDSPAETSGLRAGDRLVFVNGEDVETESHQQVVSRIRATAGRLELIVIDPETEQLLKKHNMKCLKEYVTEGVPLPFDDESENGDERRALRPRLCVIRRGPNGYGFNLHSERARPGQYIRAVDEDSPAESAGLLPKDRIVNGVPVDGKTHSQVVAAIKAGGDETRLLVVDPETDGFFKKCRVAPAADHLAGPLPEPVINGDTVLKLVAAPELPTIRFKTLIVFSLCPFFPVVQESEQMITDTIPALNLTLQQVKERAHQKRSNKRAPPMDWTKKNELFSNL
uniref:Na(+)/H(+) exchange regulatory cofactor NHE-RF n=1 Tax=Myripristis murdjan TaxID=586833 RepID=A0A667YJY8_9TELE